MDQLQHQANDKAREDAQLARDLARDPGPTDNAGRPIVAPQFDNFTHVMQPLPSPEDEAADKKSDMDRMVYVWKALPEVQTITSGAGTGEEIEYGELDAALYAIAANVVGYEAAAEDDAAEVEAATGAAPDDDGNADTEDATDPSVNYPGRFLSDEPQPRGDTVVTDGKMPGPFPTAPEAPHGT